MLLPPMAYKLWLGVEVGATEIAPTGFAQEGLTRPFVTFARNRCAGDVFATSPEPSPPPYDRKSILPPRDLFDGQLSSNEQTAF